MDHISCHGCQLSYPVLNGVAAQGPGNDDPPPNFLDHAIVKFNGKYYDPSYGTLPSNNKLDYEHGAFDGYGTFVRVRYLKPDNTMTTNNLLLWLSEKENQSILESIINP